MTAHHLSLNLNFVRLTRVYLVVLLPGVYGKILLHILSKYLECLDKVLSVSVLTLIGCGIGAAVHYLLIFTLDLGFV